MFMNCEQDTFQSALQRQLLPDQDAEDPCTVIWRIDEFNQQVTCQ